MNELACHRRFLNCVGQRIAVYEAGERDAFSIVLCHGNSSSANEFVRQFETLSAHFHLVAFDLPGHGASDDASSRETYSVPCYADVLRAVVDECCSGPLLAVGISLGGHITLEALPELTGAIAAVLVGTPPVASLSDFRAAFNPSPAVSALQKMMVSTEELHEFARACLAPRTEPPLWLIADFERTDPEARVALIESVAQNRFRDERRIVREAGVPIAHILGEHEHSICRSYFTPELLDRAWGGRLHTIPGAGHMPQWENASAFHELLDRIVRECGHRIGLSENSG